MMSFFKNFALIFLLLAGGVYYFLNKSYPLYSGSFSLRGLSRPVEVHRDTNGVPHLEAKNREDLYFALGFSMATDRPFQMDLHRRLGNGSLSEIFGKKTLPLDIKARTLGYREHFAARWPQVVEQLGPSILSYLQAYINGINEFIEKAPLPYPFKLLNYRPRPFEVLDIFAFLGHMSFKMGTSLKLDLLLTELENILPPEKMRQLKGDLERPEIFETSLTPLKWPEGIWEDLTELFALGEEYLTFEGSNAWVLSPRRTMEGKTILANDPHLSFSHPTTWYEAHLKVADFEIYGHFLPLVPFAILGMKKELAWGLTISYVDDMDFYQEKISEDGEKYFDGVEWKKLEVRREEIVVKGQKDPHIITVKKSHHGPLLDSVVSSKGLAIKWPYYLEKNTTVKGLFKMSEAEGMDSFKEAVSHIVAPGLNIAYGDDKGNIAAFVAGRIPVRNPDTSYEKILNGQNKEHDYSEYVKFLEHPHIINPKSGVIVLANYRPDGADEKVTGSWMPQDRYQTIHNLLGEQYKWSVRGLKAIQTANINHQDKIILETLLASLSEKVINNTPNAKEVIKVLQSWNGISAVDSVAATVYHYWNRSIFHLLFADLGEKKRNLLLSLPIHWRLYKRILKKSEHKWWDLTGTSEVESRDHVLRASFVKALKVLTAELGPNYRDWEWGEVHQLTFVHPLGRKKYTSWAFNLGPYPVPGAFNSVTNFKGAGKDYQFKVKSGASTRRLIDFSRPEEFWGILPLGNSGHILSPFYSDQRRKFQKGKYQKRWITGSGALKNLHSSLLLTPGLD